MEWGVNTSAHAGLVRDAPGQAVLGRRPGKGTGPVHCSDRASRYLLRSGERLAEAGIEPSIDSVGDRYGNESVKTISGPCKAGVIHRLGPWRNLVAVGDATPEWVDGCDRGRLLEPIGNIPPAEAEASLHAAPENRPQDPQLTPTISR